MIFGGQPWTEASTSQPAYAKFGAAYSKWLAGKDEASDSLKPTDTDHPHACGPCFALLPKPAIRVLLLKMLHPDPDKRATIHEILGDRWVRTIECCCEGGEEEAIGAPGSAEARAREGSTGSEKEAKRDGGKAEFDASKCCKKRALKVVKCHNHLPPKQHKIPQHRFDMGDGYS